MPEPTVLEKIVSLCKRRGLIFPGSEIYGGLNGTWDYGPLGVELLRNVKNAWWHDNVTSREDIVGLDAAIVMNRTVWQASGHESNFTDPLVDCKTCKTRFRADQLNESVCPRAKAAKAEVAASSGRVSLQRGSDEGFYHLETTKGGYFLSSADVDAIRILMSKQPSPSPEDILKFLQERSPQHYIDAIGEGDPRNAGADISKLLHRLTDPVVSQLWHWTTECEFTSARKFNLMFKTFVGPVEESATMVYLRPETAQGIFVNFKNVVDSTRIKVPFGIAQIGKAFRNEITPKQFIFRSREFEQMEIEFFCHPKSSQEWYTRWRDQRFQWYKDLGLKSEKLRLREHAKEELAHYSVGTSDVEYLFPWGWGELEGIAHRGDYDLQQHIKTSGKDLSYYDDESKERFVPHVIEPSAGATRSLLAFLCEAYDEETIVDEETKKQDTRTVLRFHPRLAPVKAAIFPLVKKDGMPERAMAIYKDLQRHFAVFYDEKGAVGRRYRRQDEAGTPFCLTIDGQTAQDQTVTVRERDSMKQERVSTAQILPYLIERLQGTKH